MSYTTTITFPVQKVNDSDTIQIIMEFTHNLTGTNRSWVAKDYNLRISNYGELEISYDLDDAFLVPGTYTLTIGDPDGVLDDLFFGPGSIAIATNKQAKVILKINGSNKFVGNCIEDTIKSKGSNKTIKIDMAPQTDLINKRMVYDDAGATLWATNNGYIEGNYYKIIDEILLPIFKLVNSALTINDIEVIHDWTFRGETINYPPYGEFDGFSFSELKQMSNYLFFDTAMGISTCGDLLKKLAVDWCCFTGFVSSEKAFFKKLFHYNPSNLQTVKVDDFEKGYRFGLIDYVKVTTKISGTKIYDEGTFTELQDRYITRDILPGFWNDGVTYPWSNGGSNIQATSTRSIFKIEVNVGTTSPTYSATYSNNGSIFRISHTNTNNPSYWVIYCERISGSNDPSTAINLVKQSGIGDNTFTINSFNNIAGEYQIHQMRDVNIEDNAILGNGDAIAKFWYKYRGNIQNCRVDKFIFRGIVYDYLKDFNHNGSKYQPVSMKFNYPNNSTTCEAIYLGEL